VTFDPFGDFETRGYLRNSEGEKEAATVRRLEHASFTTGIDDAFAKLAEKALGETGNPEFSTVMRVVGGLGLTLSARPAVTGRTSKRRRVA
jgi:hypothetical protein